MRMLFKKNSLFIGMICLSLILSGCGLNKAAEEPGDITSDEPGESASQAATEATAEYDVPLMNEIGEDQYLQQILI